MIGERVGRGIRKPVMAAVLAEAGHTIGRGRVFGLNEALDQIGATVGPLVVAFAIGRAGYSSGFGILIVPALLTLAFLLAATVAGRKRSRHARKRKRMARPFAIGERFGATRSEGR